MKNSSSSMPRERVTNRPPFYNVCEDRFYHGPAWVIKPRIFEVKENFTKYPGPSHYHIPDRSIYDRPGKTIGSRYETSLPISTHLLANYSPRDDYISTVRIPSISITPRRIELTHGRDYSARFYVPSNRTSHPCIPRLRPPCGPTTSRKSFTQSLSFNSPGPAAYPMYEFDEDILPRPQSGATQKHRFSPNSRPSTQEINPPFYYPQKIDRQRLPFFTIGRRSYSSVKINRPTAPFYSSFDNQTSCSRISKPGVTLKGRWSPLVCIPK